MTAMHQTQPATITRDYLVREIARASKISLNDAERALESMLAGMVQALKRGETVELRKFGTFHPHQRGARVGKNPKTGGPIPVPPKRVAKFRASKELLALVNC